MSELRAEHLFVWMFHANQHGYLCNQNFHGKPCHNHQKHGRPWNSIFKQDRLPRSGGANCESVCPLDLLPSMCIFVHILAVEVKTTIQCVFEQVVGPIHNLSYLLFVSLLAISPFRGGILIQTRDLISANCGGCAHTQFSLVSSNL
jgi:hypothetical protein